MGRRNGTRELARANHIEPEVRPQGSGNDNRAVGLLVVLQNGDDDARNRHERAIQGCHRRGRPVGAALSNAKSPRLEFGAVRGAGDFAVPVLGGNPCLAVELTGRT